MNTNFIRTNKTALTDDELIIFDVLFDGNVPINALKSGQDFSLHFNCNSHQLNSTELKHFIEKFVNKGLLQYKLGLIPQNITGDIVTYLGLTKEGGKLWEQEREPIWDKYVSDSFSDESGSWELSVISPTLEIAKDFLQKAYECKIYAITNPDDIKISTVDIKYHHYYIPWKVFDKLYNVVSPISESQEDNLQSDWVAFENETYFWRDVSELQFLKNNYANNNRTTADN